MIKLSKLVDGIAYAREQLAAVGKDMEGLGE